MLLRFCLPYCTDVCLFFFNWGQSYFMYCKLKQYTSLQFIVSYVSRPQNMRIIWLRTFNGRLPLTGVMFSKDKLINEWLNELGGWVGGGTQSTSETGYSRLRLYMKISVLLAGWLYHVSGGGTDERAVLRLLTEGAWSHFLLLDLFN